MEGVHAGTIVCLKRLARHQRFASKRRDNSIAMANVMAIEANPMAMDIALRNQGSGFCSSAAMIPARTCMALPWLV